MREKRTPSYRKEQVQYVFIDVVNFTSEERTVEDMVEIIRTLNTMVLWVLDECNVLETDLILIPTGDGMCICLRNQSTAERHVEVALALLEHVARNNIDNAGTGCEFSLHIGVHEGKDIIIRDINERENVIGAGINKVARIMSECPPGKVYVSTVVHEGLHRYAKYKGRFAPVRFSDKSGKEIDCYSMDGQLSPAVMVMSRQFEAFQYEIGPLLSRSDIGMLRIGDLIYHKVYGVGRIEGIADSVPNAIGRHVVITFKTKVHSIYLTNRKGNYHSCRLKPPPPVPRRVAK